MRNIQILIFEIVIVGLMVWFGFSEHKILFLQGPRSATISLGIIGMLLCTLSVGKFVSAAPAHPLTILGYLFGTIAMLTFLSQVFRWKLPFIGDAHTALIILAVCMIAKSTIARFSYLLAK
mgnify:CR=1 FL=1